MTDDELQGHLATLRAARTDHRHVEAKRSQQALPRRLWETLSAFSNSPGGGVILLGVDEADGYATVGVDDPARIQSDLQSVCAEMEPPVAAVIDVKTVGGRPLVVAEVPELPAAQKPCFHRASGMTNGAFWRQGDADRKLGAYAIQVMLSARGQPTHDVEPVSAATIDDLEPKAIAAFLRRVRERRPRFRDRADEDILRALRVLVPSDQGERAVVPSVAGLLAFGREPQAFLEQMAVLFTAFPGRSVGELGPNGERVLDDVRIEGNIAQMVAQTITRIVGNMRHPRRAAGDGRTVEPELPRAALSEALVNALAHRDLSPHARGTGVQVQLFADRLVVLNPGGLFGPVTVDELGTGGHSSARNAVLMQLLEDAVDPATGYALAEHRGTGIAAMIAALREAAMSPPRFDDRVVSFHVVFPRQSLLDPEALAWLATLGTPADGLTRDQRTALVLMRAGETMTNERYRQVSGADSRVATRELGELVERGLASSGGRGRWTTYALAAPNVTAVARTRTRGDRRPEIRRLLRQSGAVSRAELAKALGLTQTGVARWLRVMRDGGEIEATTPNLRDHRVKYRLTSPPEGSA